MGNAVKIFKHFEAPRQEGVYHRLVCLTGKNKGQAYFLMGKRVVLGRADNADIRILDIKSSREHAEIINVGKDYVLTDLGSQNGIIVNDLKIRQHVLNEGDKIIIGKTVYKFNKVEVKSKEENVKAVKLKDEMPTQNEGEVEEKPKSKKGNIILSLIAVGAIALLLSEDDGNTDNKRKRTSKYNIQEINGSAAVVLKGAKKKDEEVQKKLNIYFQKGLREFREGNYFRAMSEFEHALAWSPNDGQAKFYLSKTKGALDKTINELLLKGKRDEESLKWQAASVSYCQVLRLLYRYPEDERYKEAKENLSHVETVLGYDEGQIECMQEIK